jgi:hypothetical protein
VRTLLRHRPSASMVIACLALFVALGGVGYAAATIDSGDIVNNSVKSKDIKNRGIATKDLSRKAVAALKGQKGDKGDTGATGATGAPGAPGATNVVVRQSRDGSASSGGVVQADVSCAAGEALVGGGGGAVVAANPSPASYDLDGANVTVTLNGPSSANGINEPTDGAAPTTWSFAAEIDSATPHDAVVYAVCAKP